MNQLKTNRIESLDLLKGIVLVLMALDHTRDYFHSSAFIFNPLDPQQTTWAIFLTRWVTHFCAPTFSLLAGISAFFVGRKKTPNELSKFLIKRGLWLIIIQLTVIQFAWYFDPNFRWIELDVIGSLGASMILLAFLVHTHQRFILVFSCLMIFGHNLLDNFHFNGSPWWAILHEEASFPLGGGYSFIIFYPLIPWIGVMSLGYWMGRFYDKSYDPGRRRRLFAILGVSAIVLFIILRGFNFYGNPDTWIDFNSLPMNLMSILATNKYPPSLSFLLMTLGPAFLFMAYFENAKGKVVDFLMTIGKVPFLFYIIHLYLIHALAMLASELTWTGWKTMILSKWITDVEALDGYGFSLPVVYLIWAVIMILLYPICRKFSIYKTNHKEKQWLSYF